MRVKSLLVDGVLTEEDLSILKGVYRNKSE